MSKFCVLYIDETFICYRGCKGVVFFYLPGKDTFSTKTSKKEWVSTFCGILFPLCRKKKPYNTLKILRQFSLKNLGLICVWVFRFLDKNCNNICNFVIIIFHNRKSTLPTILSNICTNISSFSYESFGPSGIFFPSYKPLNISLVMI